MLAAACNESALAPGTASGSSSSFGKNPFTGAGTVVNSGGSVDPQCIVFQNNSRDLAACTGCKKSLCPTSDLSSCTIDSAQLVTCVHNNVASAGGPCIGLLCGANQIANFNS